MNEKDSRCIGILQIVLLFAVKLLLIVWFIAFGDITVPRIVLGVTAFVLFLIYVRSDIKRYKNRWLIALSVLQYIMLFIIGVYIFVPQEYNRLYNYYILMYSIIILGLAVWIKLIIKASLEDEQR